MDSEIPDISVILPTRKRPEHLRRCLASLAAQTLPVSEILVGLREDDTASTAVLAEPATPPLARRIVVGGRGVVGSMNSCLDASKGAWLLLIDDDVELPPNWVAVMAGHLKKSGCVVGAGGRDFLQDHPEMRRTEKRVPDVGEIEAWGRITGNHHRGSGVARPVRFLRGSNCLYRGDFLRRHRFETALLGEGAQVHWELALGFHAMNEDLQLIYDPEMEVLHHVAPRHDNDANHRGGFDAKGVHDMAFNEFYILRHHARGLTRWSCLFWNLAVGSKTCPGLLQTLRLLATRSPRLRERLAASWSGHLAAWKTPPPSPERAHS